MPIFPSPILLAPAGNWSCLSAALQNGANAVYFGVGRWNMRSRANTNFLREELPEVVRRCHESGVKAWLTVNIIAYDQELEEFQGLLEDAKRAGVDAVIGADPAVLLRARALGLPVHISVQANISNVEAIAFYAPYADTVVAARELTLEQLSALAEGIRERDLRGPGGELIRLEAFVHGALCIGLSGRCGMSLCEYNASSNRGSCYQPCRREYLVQDVETGTQFRVENRYIMSPKDLCTISGIPWLLGAGVSVLKIEGRGRSADYVATVTRVYREAVDLWCSGEVAAPQRLEGWRRALSQVFNRQFWDGGYYYGVQSDIWAGDRDSQATIQKRFLGIVTHYYGNPQVAEILLQAGNLRKGDRILVTGPTTGAVEGTVPTLQVQGREVDFAGIGSQPTLPFSPKVRSNDKVFLLSPRVPRGPSGREFF